MLVLDCDAPTMPGLRAPDVEAVPVLVVEALEGAPFVARTPFVGLLVGLRIPLGRLLLAFGVGLVAAVEGAPSRAPSPKVLCLFNFPFAADVDPAGASLTTRLIPVARRNIPRPIAQRKYRSPLTAPSFFPEVSSSSTPTHSPVWKEVVPAKRTRAKRPSFSSMR